MAHLGSSSGVLDSKRTGHRVMLRVVLELLRHGCKKTRAHTGQWACVGIRYTGRCGWSVRMVGAYQDRQRRSPEWTARPRGTAQRSWARGGWQTFRLRRQPWFRCLWGEGKGWLVWRTERPVVRLAGHTEGTGFSILLPFPYQPRAYPVTTSQPTCQSDCLSSYDSTALSCPIHGRPRKLLNNGVYGLGIHYTRRFSQFHPHGN